MASNEGKLAMTSREIEDLDAPLPILIAFLLATLEAFLPHFNEVRDNLRPALQVLDEIERIRLRNVDAARNALALDQTATTGLGARIRQDNARTRLMKIADAENSAAMADRWLHLSIGFRQAHVYRAMLDTATPDLPGIVSLIRAYFMPATGSLYSEVAEEQRKQVRHCGKAASRDLTLVHHDRSKEGIVHAEAKMSNPKMLLDTLIKHYLQDVGRQQEVLDDIFLATVYPRDDSERSDMSIFDQVERVLDSMPPLSKPWLRSLPEEYDVSIVPKHAIPQSALCRLPWNETRSLFPVGFIIQSGQAAPLRPPSMTRNRSRSMSPLIPTTTIENVQLESPTEKRSVDDILPSFNDTWHRILSGDTQAQLMPRHTIIEPIIPSNTDAAKVTEAFAAKNQLKLNARRQGQPRANLFPLGWDPAANRALDSLAARDIFTPAVAALIDSGT
ncbi:uncharacterized protein L969DRAFT_96860 [Mixia osmundae IAM 14324]|uniref:Uncharacterized protein n=1 Tax=Mixia osmundae (strain CBS 9802 / IAM 14324 / JCM 22182 / KY 12970) TaxID=764103 RepID=G7E2A9_MIXOS|nr:uncharacterized protein L969DRAFT_96860 [Mixia osmundae IAM 14324]KEI36842.1 hypothetical protein L969DRAFT_96860 [Mixia osmundae IAM 14324]GAA96969.1 hypothetical protein E5Q_03643 [Mixia osmundae IAM 14324]